MRAGNWIGRAFALAAVITVAGCVAQYRLHGYTPSEEQLAEIIVGIDTRDSVAETVGPPTTSGVTRSDAYFYVSEQVRTYGIAAPKAVDRQVVAVRFDAEGVVSNVERYTLEDGRVVPISRRVTDTNVEDVSFLQQLFGNVGGLDLTNAF